MADEAFALSPISARAAMPSDADYDAIREAFMETSRGRWFLSEYAKRNRNADTRMVLDAVARIEQNLSAQKQANGSPAVGDSLVAISAIVGEARAEVARAIAGLDNDATLTAARDGARIIREVSWTLRECGADVRICNLLDNQVTAIEAGQRLVSEIDREAVLAAFDGLLDRVHDLAGHERPHRSQPLPASDDPTSPAADGDLPEAAIIVAESPDAAESPVPSAAAAPESQSAEAAVLDPALTIVTGTATDELEFVEAGSVATAAPSSSALDTAGADGLEPPVGENEDVDTMLDLVALEMSAPQPDEPGELEAAIEAARLEAELTEAAERAEAQQAEAVQREATTAPDIARLVAEVAMPHEPAIDLSGAETEQPGDMQSFEIGERGEPLYVPEPPLHPVAARMVEPATVTAPPAPSAAAVSAAPTAGASASLGAALLASGMVTNPGQARSDALAPLRRMSQPEKIAFFS
ncbi:hypothetical protein LPW26_23860 [Rhodopseudomonas sp. HC1]|uniref:hypothetical protein n=1 Tax=Rhodopseudomonas infernalis TaxID=2897386 RepID=UPI001EE7AAFE|nr:hypothetical protein [Rhodopseudomonas infernalis]MCG6207694.1 hypothetical protein [Rhodopseudomonas infernalis]